MHCMGKKETSNGGLELFCSVVHVTVSNPKTTPPRGRCNTTACDSEPNWRCYMPTVQFSAQCQSSAATCHTPPLACFRSIISHPSLQKRPAPSENLLRLPCHGTASPSLCDEPGPFHSGLAGGYSDVRIAASSIDSCQRRGRRNKTSGACPSSPLPFLPFLPSSKSILQILPSPLTTLSLL